MASIAIIGGCGHVGLPLGLAFASAGQQVVAIDIDAAKVEQTNGGTMPFRDKGADETLARVLQDGSFRCSTEKSNISAVDVIVSVIGTPVDEHLNPEFGAIRRFVEEYREYFCSGQLLILRSTVFPRSTDRLQKVLSAAGLDLDVAFCPERVAEGVALEEIRALPQIVAGCSETATERASELFSCLTKDIIVLPPVGAELTKLFNNVWRYVQFAVANQFYMITNDYGIDFYDIYDAMKLKYPRASEFPSAGFAAGPCLFKDTMQLSASHNNNLFLGHSAMLINEGLPNYLVRRVGERFDLSSMTIGILGLTFKANSDDTRDSLAFKLKKLLEADAKEVICADPNLDDPRLCSIQELLERSDLIFIGAPHEEFKELRFAGKDVVDIWNITSHRMATI